MDLVRGSFSLVPHAPSYKVPKEDRLVKFFLEEISENPSLWGFAGSKGGGNKKSRLPVGRATGGMVYPRVAGDCVIIYHR